MLYEYYAKPKNHQAEKSEIPIYKNLVHYSRKVVKKKRGEEKERQLQNVILYKQTPNQL